MAATADAQAAALLTWYQHAQRELPWRQAPTPYAVLVSELMLQQTRVETVRAYFVRWMARWPTIADLASATEAEVLAMWTGLGYYHRARNLHAAAQAVGRAYGGHIPSDAAALGRLPGLGPYTVGAVRSIAFGEPAPLVDGNVARVLARWSAWRGDPQQARGRAALWAMAEAWLELPAPRATPGAWNQALMELGATLCTPRSPQCSRCPVADDCLAQRTGTVAAIPPPRQKPQPVLVQAAYAVICTDPALASGVADPVPAVLLGRRPLAGRWPGLWEPPGVEGPDCLLVLRQHLLAAGLTPGEPLGPIVHLLTHRRYEVLALPVRIAPGDLPRLEALGYAALRLVPLSATLDVVGGLSRLAQKLVALAM